MSFNSLAYGYMTSIISITIVQPSFIVYMDLELLRGSKLGLGVGMYY